MDDLRRRRKDVRVSARKPARRLFPNLSEDHESKDEKMVPDQERNRSLHEPLHPKHLRHVVPRLFVVVGARLTAWEVVDRPLLP